MEAKVILCKCNKSSKAFGIRVQKGYDGDWYRTWAFELNDKVAINEGYDKTSVTGGLNAIGSYPGCPYCGTMQFAVCGSCKKMVCYSGETAYSCPWCGHWMENFVEEKTFNIETDIF